MKIVFFNVEKWQGEIIKEKLKRYECFTFHESLTDEDIDKIQDVEILSIRARGHNLYMGEDVLSRLPNLKFIVTRSTGFDHIDIEACKKRKISVANIPSYSETSVAEHTFALLLAISRRMPFFTGNEPNLFIEERQSINLQGKTMGVIGSGKIGLKVIALAKAFGMDVIAYDIFENKEAVERIGFNYVLLEELLKRSDMITLHTPLTPLTKDIVNKENIGHMKKGVILINTARGDLIDANALLDGIDKGIVSFAGLDLVGGEKENTPLSKQPSHVQRIRTHPRILITNHEAGNSIETRELAINIAIDKILLFIDGKLQSLLA